jgi:hypothetical protein
MDSRQSADGGHHPGVVGHNKRYIGFVDVVDLTCMLLTSGLRRSTPKGILKRLGAAFLPDDDHRVGFAVNYSGQDRFLHVPSSATLAQVLCCVTLQNLYPLMFVTSRVRPPS